MENSDSGLLFPFSVALSTHLSLANRTHQGQTHPTTFAPLILDSQLLLPQHVLYLSSVSCTLTHYVKEHIPLLRLGAPSPPPLLYSAMVESLKGVVRDGIGWMVLEGCQKL